jgi:hypothetical protein
MIDNQLIEKIGLTVWSNICKRVLIFGFCPSKHLYILNKAFRPLLYNSSLASENLAVIGELGRYPLFIEIIISMFSYLTHISNNKDILLSEALSVSKLNMKIL